MGIHDTIVWAFCSTVLEGKMKVLYQRTMMRGGGGGGGSLNFCLLLQLSRASGQIVHIQLILRKSNIARGTTDPGY